MFRSISATLGVLVLCLMFAALDTTALAGCEGVYFKPEGRAVLGSKVYFYEYDPRFNVHDMTGDGDLDVIGFIRNAGNVYTRVYILPGLGTGGFGTPIQINLPAAISPGENGFRVGDFNADGKQDFVVFAETSPRAAIVYQNDGTGDFAALTPSVISTGENIVNWVDVNNDSRADLITGGSYPLPSGFFYRLANADGTFGAMVQLASAEYRFPADFNGDGKVDFAFISGSGGSYRVQFYYNLGNGIFALGEDSTTVDTTPVFLVGVAELNGDNRPDLVFNSPFQPAGFGSLVVLINQGEGKFLRSAMEYPYQNLRNLNPGILDFNGDGALDLMAMNSDSQGKGYTVYTNDGSGSFTARPYNERIPGVPVGDLDGDSKADFLRISNYDYQDNSVPLKVFDETQLTVVKNVCNKFGQTKIVDFDGDGLADPSFWRESDGRWRYQARNFPYTVETYNWGQPGDIAMPGDYDGDGRTDHAVFRPSVGTWFYTNSSTGALSGVQFGADGDRPVASDYDGDGRTDIAVFRPSTGVWYILYSGSGGFAGVQFGLADDKVVPEDYDGDGKTDIAVFRPSSGVWYILRSSDGGFFGVTWGLGSDTLAPADYDGDGKADITVYRAGVWYINRSNGFAPAAFPFGTATDLPQVSDWNGDFIFDTAVYRPTNKVWYTSYNSYINFSDVAGEMPVSTMNH